MIELAHPQCITLPGNALGTYSIPASTTFDAIAGGKIDLLPGFLADRSMPGSKPVTIRTASCAGYAVSHLLSTTIVPWTAHKLKKFELAVDLPLDIREQIYLFLDQNTTRRAFAKLNIPPTNTTEQLNPFDPSDIEVKATFTHSSGTVLTRYAFFCPKVKTAQYDPNLTSSYTCNGTSQVSITPNTLYEALMVDEFKHDDVFLYKNRAASKCSEYIAGTGSPSIRKDVWDVDVATSSLFKVRFAPTMIGTWTVGIQFKVKGQIVCMTVPTSFFVADAPIPSKGYLKRSTSTGNGDLFSFSETNEFFFPLGYNIWSARPGSLYGDFCPEIGRTEYMHNFLTSMSKLKSSKGNFFRLGCDATHFNIEWEDLGNYFTRMGAADDLDSIVENAEANELYFIMTLFSHHDFQRAYNEFGGGCQLTGKYDHGKEYGRNEVLERGNNRSGGFGPQAHWYSNPYYTEGDNSTPSDDYAITPYDMFVPVGGTGYNANIYKYMRNKIQYYVARWGYSTSIAAWELMDEIQQTFANHTISVPASVATPIGSQWADYFLSGSGQVSYYGGNERPTVPGYRYKLGAPSNEIQINAMETQLNVTEWLREMADFIRGHANGQLDDPHLLSASQAGDINKTIRISTETAHYLSKFSELVDVDQLDILQVHSYTSRFDQNIEVRPKQVNQFRTKTTANPRIFLFGEMGMPEGMEKVTPIDFHNALWSTTFMGGAGPGLSWYWNFIDGTYNYHSVSLELGATFPNNQTNTLLKQNTGQTPYLSISPPSACKPGITKLGENGGSASIDALARYMEGRDLRQFVSFEVKTYSASDPDLQNGFQNNQIFENYNMRTDFNRDILGWLHNRTFWSLGLRPNGGVTKDYLDDFYGTDDLRASWDGSCNPNYSTCTIPAGGSTTYYQTKRCDNIPSYQTRGASTMELSVPKADYFDTGDICGCANGTKFRVYPDDFFDATVIEAPILTVEGLNPSHAYDVHIFPTRNGFDFPFDAQNLPPGGWQLGTNQSLVYPFYPVSQNGTLNVPLPFPINYDHPDIAYHLVNQILTGNGKSAAVQQQEDPLANITMAIVPNPTRESVVVSLIGENCTNGTIEIADPMGKVVMQIPIEKDSIQLDVSALSAGIYSVTFKSNICRIHRKLVIQ
ncbi:MAG: T9SS type A sorting domain-containing protein [Bacteroidetes bacterium]|nr:T9SS type A sorting domain-containing protein [Bacteroidota bacterium]